MFRKILIANRGEIAVRIIRACRDLGISPVAVYSEADRDSLAVRLADQACAIGPSPASQSYLSIEKILDAAGRSGAEAIHPGYGFLAENEAFARACQEGGLTFIGPPAGAIQLMGDKIASRHTARSAGVPVVPGSDHSLDSLEETLSAAAQIGYPLMLKASAGGGGKGLRLVRSDEELRSLYATTRSEAQASFNDPRVFLEKYIERPRHIEIQLLADGHGTILHLGERECSIQRRHQKVVEEAPSPRVGTAFRQRLGEAAIAVAAAVNYQNAGTVEFLVDGSSEDEIPPFYFLEMNTRLQVEHPVTEMVTGIDLVTEQIRLACGERLGYGQSEIQLRGAALECRIYAEDPRNQFAPSPGEVTYLAEPSGPGVRNDSGICAGFKIPVHYDPMISKLVAFADSRPQAIARMRRALREYRICGVRTTIPFFETLLSHPEFVAGHLHTGFIEEHDLAAAVATGDGDETPAIVAAVLHHLLEEARTQTVVERTGSSRWKDSGRPAGSWSRW